MLFCIFESYQLQKNMHTQECKQTQYHAIKSLKIQTIKKNPYFNEFIGLDKQGKNHMLTAAPLCLETRMVFGKDK